jgi:hypothetical protein
MTKIQLSEGASFIFLLTTKSIQLDLQLVSVGSVTGAKAAGMRSSPLCEIKNVFSFTYTIPYAFREQC